MNTVELQTTLHKLIDHINDDNVLRAYVLLLSREAEPEPDFWDSLDIPTKTAIKEGVQDLDSGRKTDFFQYMEQQHGITR